MVTQPGHHTNFSVCSDMHDVRAVNVVSDGKDFLGIVNVPLHDHIITSQGWSFMRCLVVVQDNGWAALCSISNKTQSINQHYHISQVQPRNRRNSSICFSSSRLTLHSLSLLYWKHHQHPELSRHYATWTKYGVSFQNTPDNIHNFLSFTSAAFCYMQLYCNANDWNVDSFSTHCKCTKL